MSLRQSLAWESFWLVLSAVATSGCYEGVTSDGGDGGDGGSTALVTSEATSSEETGVPSELGRVEITVVSTDGKVLPGARVMAGAASWTADADGRVVVSGLPARRFVARVEGPEPAPGELPEYVRGGVVLDLPPDADLRTRVTLLRHQAYASFDAARGGAIETGTVRVYIAPDSLVDEHGQAVTGMITPTVVPIDPLRDLGVMPGPLRAGSILLESVFMAEITLWQDGRPLQLAAGATAHVALRVPDGLVRRYAPLETLPGWSYDYAAGTWRAEDVVGVFRTASDDGALWWHAELPHFSLWNADGPIEEIGCVEVELKVKDENQDPVVLKDGLVTLVGTNYAGYDSGVTDEFGQACLQMPTLCVNDTELCTAAVYLGTLNDPEHLLLGEVVGLETPGTCNGDCVKFTKTLEQGDNVCTWQDSVECGVYSGPNGTEGEGACSAPQQTCNELGTAYGECEEVLPVGDDEPANDCDAVDDDCDGIVELGPDCPCDNNEVYDCYGGTPGELNTALPPKVCKAGHRECVGGILQPECIDDNAGLDTEIAGGGDDDCDGLLNENDDPYLWAHAWDAAGQEGSQIATDMVVTPGYIYVAGHFSHGVDLGPNCLAPGDNDRDIFVARYDPDGVCLGLITLDPHTTIQQDVRIAHEAGELWLIGGCDGDVKSNGMLITTCAAKSSFVAKLDMDLLMVSEPTPLAFMAADVTAEGGDPIIVGSREDSLYLQRGADPPSIHGGGETPLSGRRIEFDGVSNAVYVAGTYRGNPDGLMLGGTPEPSYGQGVLVMKLNPADLQPLTAAYLSDPTVSQGATVQALAVGSPGVAVAGKVEGPLHVPPVVDVAFQTPMAAYAVAFDHDLAAKWHRSFTVEAGGEIGIFHGLTFGPGPRLYAGGEFSGSIKIAGTTYVTESPLAQDADMLLVQMDVGDGRPVWSAQFGGPLLAESVRALAAEGPYVLAAGFVGQDITLSPNNPDTAMDWHTLADIFLAKMLP